VQPRSTKADLDQSAEFIRVARELGCEENFDRLDEALRGIIEAGSQHCDAPKRAKAGSRPPD
jgi:hypothetical protein